MRVEERPGNGLEGRVRLRPKSEGNLDLVPREEGDERNRPFIGRWPRGLYESEGFVAEGVLRDSFWTGDEHESLVVMSILESEYRA